MIILKEINYSQIPNKLQPLFLSFSQPEFLNHWEKEFRALDKKKNK
jgi:hypothetical protein